MNTANPKCGACKCYWIPDETDVKSSGLVCKTCKKCREIQKQNRLKWYCQHNKRKTNCKECGGSALCTHNRLKQNCKDCKGVSICIHNQRRNYCIECGGSSLCKHNKYKSDCRECGGSAFCIHNKYKTLCKECDGGSLCIHKQRKTCCRECGGSAFCIHNKQKTCCRECGGSAFCIHNKRKTDCRECGGSGFCIHNKQKRRCRECGGSGFCKHNKRKEYCKVCNLHLYLVNLQRNHIYRCFKSSTLDKTKHSVEYLDCSVEDLIEHFNKKIEYFNTYLATDTAMTWDNIHIDHIKPISRFDLDNEDEFLDCCHYTNLQPLIDVDNLEKSNRWTDENEKYWLENIKGNVDYHEVYV